MTATLTNPDTVLDELITDALPPPRGEGGGEGPDDPGRPRSEPTASAVAPPFSDSGSWQRQALPRHPSISCNPKSQDPIPSDLLNRLITLYTTHSSSFTDLCRELDLSMLELLDVLEHPGVLRALERLAQANEARAKLLARMTSAAAVSALIDLMDTTDKPETRRKAAGAILRHGKPPANSATRQPRNCATDSDAPVAGQSVSLRRNAARDVCQTPRERSSGAGLVSNTPGGPRATSASGRSPPSRTEPKKSQAA